MDELPAAIVARLDVGDCWLWTGQTCASGAKVYGRFRLGGRKARLEWAHRLVWRLLVGPPPPVLHHLCETALCCNPDHLMPTTRSAHASHHQRATHCLRGHLLPPMPADGRRYCRRCINERRRETDRARREVPDE